MQCENPFQVPSAKYKTLKITVYRTQENFGRGKNWQIWQIVSYSPKFFSPIFTDTLKMYLAYALTVAYSPNFSSLIALTCMVRLNPPQKFSVHGAD